VVTQVAGVSVQLLEFSRFQNTYTARLRFTNSSTQDQYMGVTANSYLYDNATSQRLELLDQSNPGVSQRVPANTSIDVWAKYGLSSGEVPQYLDLVLPNGVLFPRLTAQEIEP
jgi:hypothetical protein